MRSAQHDAFLSLRMEPTRSRKFRDYATAMFALIQPIVPIAAEAFVDYQLGDST